MESPPRTHSPADSRCRDGTRVPVKPPSRHHPTSWEVDMHEVIGTIATLLLLVGLTMLNSARTRGRRRRWRILDDVTARAFEARRRRNAASFDRDRQC